MNPIRAPYEVDDAVCTNLEWDRRAAPAPISEAPVLPPIPTTPNRFADAETTKTPPRRNLFPPDVSGKLRNNFYGICFWILYIIWGNNFYAMYKI